MLLNFTAHENPKLTWCYPGVPIVRWLQKANSYIALLDAISRQILLEYGFVIFNTARCEEAEYSTIARFYKNPPENWFRFGLEYQKFAHKSDPDCHKSNRINKASKLIRY